MKQYYIVRKATGIVDHIVNEFEDGKVTVQKSPIRKNGKWIKFLPVFETNYYVDNIYYNNVQFIVYELK